MSQRLFWPLALIVGGVLLLLSNFNLLPGNIWNYIWPVFLILLGVSILFRWPGGRRLDAVNDSLALDGATSANLRFNYAAGRLCVNSTGDSSLLFTGAFGGGVEKEVRRTGGEFDVSLRSPSNMWAGPWDWFGARSGLDWNVALNASIPLGLTFETGASNATLDLTKLHLTRLDLKTGASTTEIVMPATATSTRARIESGAASVKVRIPNGVAGRIYGKMGVGSLNVDTRRFPPRAGAYESDDFATAANRVELEVQGGVGSVDVR